MRVFPVSLVLFGLLAFLFAAAPSSAATWPPTLTIYDEAGGAYTAPDNSAVFSIIPGGRCTFEVDGEANREYTVVYSPNTTGNMNGLFIGTPYYFLLPGPFPRLDGNGMGSFPVTVPRGFVTSDLTLYTQAAVIRPGQGYTLTNGITFEILVPSVNADLAVHVGPYPGQGNGLDYITEIGRLDDDKAEDNVVNGTGIDNGESIDPAPDFNGQIMAYLDPGKPTDRYPEPSNAIFLNGYSHLVPGDAGLHPDFSYPQRGSQMGIYSRSGICRDFENPAVQHIVVPPIDGGIQKDQNIYHVKFATSQKNPSWGFATLDVETNQFHVITGSVIQKNISMDVDYVSPWDCNVAVSPDGVLMAAVRKNRGVFYTDQLFLMRLDGTTWANGQETKEITVEAAPSAPYKDPSIIFAETLTFLETDQPGVYALYFATSYNPKAQPPYDPPETSASAVWRYTTSDTSDKALILDRTYVLPPTGNGWEPKYLGETNQYSVSEYPSSPQVSTVNWITSEDHRTLCFPMAGRDNSSTPWEWDVYCITDVKASGSQKIVNVSGFAAVKTVVPFGRCYNGKGRAAISDDGSMVAFMTVDDGATDQDICFYATDGSDQGMPGLLSTGEFSLSLSSGFQSVVDPFIVDDDDILFFCGEEFTTSKTINTDLFLFTRSTGTYRNLTGTGTKTPPFTKVGNVVPGGYFLGRDGRDFYFFRGQYLSNNNLMNLVGVDLLNDFNIFSLTGSEFNGGIEIVPDIAIEKSMGVQDMNVTYASSPDTDVVFFSARYRAAPAASYQVFMMQEANPFAALPITSFGNSQVGIIDNLVASDDGLMVAFSRSNRADQYAGQAEKIFAVDVNAYCYTRDLTPDYNYDIASVDGSLRFIPGETLPPNPTEPQLVYAFGMGSSGADNPFPARAWVYPLNELSNSALPSVSYPLTAAGSVYIYSAKP